MTVATTQLPLTNEIQDVRRVGQSPLRAVIKNPLGLAAAIFLMLVILSAVFAPLLAPYSPTHASLEAVLSGPSAHHPLGADGAGRDVLSRLLFASRYSLAGALLTLAVAAIFGITGGLVAGYYGGWFDTVSSWLVNLIMALPGFVVLLAAIAVLGPSLWLSMAIFGLLMSPGFFRLVYASVRAVRNELYIDAARVSGISDGRIIGRHVLGVVRAPALIQAAHIASVAVAIQSGLGLLGLGDPNLPTWGSMLQDGFTNMYRDPVLLLWPGLVIALTCIAFALLANALRDGLEGSRARPIPRRVRATAARAVAKLVSADKLAAAEVDVVLSIRDLRVEYPRPDGASNVVVDGVSLRVRRGEVHGLVGESGSGKTQTAWSVLGLLPVGGRVSNGSIKLVEQELRALDRKALRRLRGTRIAYIPQEPLSNLDPSFTIGSQLVEPLRVCHGLSKPKARERALSLLERVGITDPARVFGSYPHELSGGMAQRVLIAGAISGRPQLLIADEPTTALDVTVQAEVLELLRDLQKEYGMAMLLVTHNFGVVADICDRVSVMNRGRIVEEGTVREIFNSPKDPYTQMLLNAIIDETEPRDAYIQPKLVIDEAEGRK